MRRIALIRPSVLFLLFVGHALNPSYIHTLSFIHSFKGDGLGCAVGAGKLLNRCIIHHADDHRARFNHGTE